MPYPWISQGFEWIRKDFYAVRGLATAVAILTFITSVTAPGLSFDPIGQGGMVLLMGAMFWGWIAVAERIMHRDPVPGDREIWYTLPVSRPVIALSKLLLITGLIFIPRIAGDWILALFWRADPWAVVLDTVPRTVFFFTALVLPAVVIASVTRNMAQFYSAAIALALYLYGVVLLFSFDYSWTNAIPWISGWVLIFTYLPLCLALALWLYHSRFVPAGFGAVLVLLGALILGAPWIPPSAQWALHHRLHHNTQLEPKLSFDFREADLLLPAEPKVEGDYQDRRRPVREFSNGLPLPLTLVLGDASIDAVIREGRFSIRSIDGRSLADGEFGTIFNDRPQRDLVPFLSPNRTEEGVFDYHVIERLPDTVVLDLTLHLELFRRKEHHIDLHKGWNFIDGVGYCKVADFRAEHGYPCVSRGPHFVFAAFRGLPLQQWFSSGSLDDQTATIPIPDWSPLDSNSNSLRPGNDITYDTWSYEGTAVAHVTIPNYHVANYTWKNMIDFIE